MLVYAHTQVARELARLCSAHGRHATQSSSSLLSSGSATADSFGIYSSWCSKGRYIEWIETATALLLVALVSMQLILTVASLSLGAGYDGAQVQDARTWRQTSFEWASQHCISFFFAAALVGGRFETQNPAISRWLLRVFWFGVPALLV